MNERGNECPQNFLPKNHVQSYNIFLKSLQWSPLSLWNKVTIPSHGIIAFHRLTSSAHPSMSPHSLFCSLHSSWVLNTKSIFVSLCSYNSSSNRMPIKFYSSIKIQLKCCFLRENLSAVLLQDSSPIAPCNSCPRVSSRQGWLTFLSPWQAGLHRAWQSGGT